MRKRGAFLAGVLALVVLVVGCGRRSSPSAAADSTGASRAAIATSPNGAAAKARSPCPATGQWAACSVEQRIRKAGLVARKIGGDSPARAAFTVKPTVYALGRDSRLEVFIYPSAAALARDVENMDTIAVAPRGVAEKWNAPPTFVRSANLAAVLLSHDAREADRLFLALTAGPPSAAAR